MRLLMAYAGPYPHLGGLSTHMTLMAKGLRELGHEVDIVSLSSLPVPIYYLLFKGPSHVLNRISEGLGTVYLLRASRAFFALLLSFMARRRDYDLINAHNIASALGGAFVRRSLRIPLAQTVHTYFTLEMSSIGVLKAGSRFEGVCRAAEAKAYTESSYIIAVDNRIRDYVIGQGIPQERIVVMINPVDVDEFRPGGDVASARKSFALPEDRPVILCPRRLVKKNGVVYAALAAEILRKSIPRFVVAFAGEGDERRAIERERDRLDLRDHIVMLGAVDHARMAELYTASDVVVVPSVNSYGLEEATSISALEAMAAGAPVVASRIGGLRDIIVDGVTGTLVKEADERELAEAVRVLLTDNAKYESVRAAARKYVVDNFSVRSRASQFVAAYDSHEPAGRARDLGPS